MIWLCVAPSSGRVDYPEMIFCWRILCPTTRIIELASCQVKLRISLVAIVRLVVAHDLRSIWTCRKCPNSTVNELPISSGKTNNHRTLVGARIIWVGELLLLVGRICGRVHLSSGNRSGDDERCLAEADGRTGKVIDQSCVEGVTAQVRAADVGRVNLLFSE